MISPAKYSAGPISLTLLLILNLSLLWCSDPGCVSDENGDGCPSLSCTLLYSQSDQSDHASPPAAKNCSCVAQTPLLVSKPMMINLIVQSEGAPIVVEASLLTSPNRLILRPPII